MGNKRIGIVFIIIILFTIHVKSQDTLRIKLVNENLQKHNSLKVQYQSAKKNRGPIQYIFAGLFLSYKKLISSQDGNHCMFYPTCSEYGMLAVKKQFFILGIFDTFDRLVRCNGNHSEMYEYDDEKECYIDYP